MSKISLRSIQRRIYRINWIENKQIISATIENNTLIINNTEKQQTMSFAIVNNEIEQVPELFDITQQPVHKDDNGNIIKVKDWVKIARPGYSRQTRKIAEPTKEENNEQDS